MTTPTDQQRAAEVDRACDVVMAFINELLESAYHEPEIAVMLLQTQSGVEILQETVSELIEPTTVQSRLAVM